MEKYLVTIEFRYSAPPTDKIDWTSRGEKITMGVFDDFNKACDKGNELIETLESRFKLHVFPKGNKAPKERFSKNGGCFGSKKDLITNLAFLQTPFDFYAKITTLKCEDVEQTIDQVVKSVKEYRAYKENNEDD